MTRIELIRKLVLRDLDIVENLIWSAVFVGLPTALRYALGQTANPVPFVTYFPFILLMAVFQGWRWAVGGTLVSALIVNWVFLSSPWLRDAAPPDVAILAFFCASCAVLIVAGDTLRRTVRQLDRIARDKELIFQEMHHRVRNAFTVIQALVRMSRNTGDVSQFRDDLLGRVRALDQANSLLRDQIDERLSVRRLVEMAIEPFRQGGDFVLEGPDHDLDPRVSYQLLLMLHELSTNALKHGALSEPGGRVFVSWTDAEGRIALNWREEGGPPIVAVPETGLGLRLLKGQSVFDARILFEEQGLLCELAQKS